MNNNTNTNVPSTDMEAFRATLLASKNVIAVAGAGLSAASGIPTFRGTGGLWRKYNAIELATPRAFRHNPSRGWQFYHYRRETALRATPNAAHDALAKFSLPSVRDTIVPGSTFTLVTQNVDGLSRLALDKALSGSSSPKDLSTEPPKLLEMHGRVFDVKCTECEYVEFDRSSPICEALRGTEELVERNVIDPDIAVDQLPRCKKCGALARPGVVWFEERPLYLDIIDELVEKADLCIVVGTSSTVYPAAGYASLVQANGGKVAVFNLERSAGDKEADYLFLGPCEETLPQTLALTS
ncbi:DHS-like NAD/FAD-binding domain-containing protein [Marasmius fiardii PR-910]|nr:DHS-like NAD/FAD-binding domain-containing protein [Marasmius fiardii PR-910]